MRGGHYSNSIAFQNAHEARVVRNIERLQTLSALLQTHEQLDYNDRDNEYLKTLRYRIQKIKSQLKHMGIDIYAT